MNKEHRPSSQSGKRVGGSRVCALYSLPHCHMKRGCQMSKYPTE
jgi:hypothetical protein